jgi:hypothetical protein
MCKSSFDIAALFDALDAQRCDRALSWQGVAQQLWDQSATLNAQRGDHPISASTLTGMAKRSDTTCQHALFMLRWLGRTPESFMPGSTADAMRPALPFAGPDQRLRWDLQKLYDALDSERRERNLTWPQLAHELQCTPSQLSGIRRARFAIGMKLAMRIVAWLHRPAVISFTRPTGESGCGRLLSSKSISHGGRERRCWAADQGGKLPAIVE